MSEQLAKIAAASSHLIASEIAKAGIPAPEAEVIRMAWIEDADIQVCVSITRRGGTPRLHLTPTGAAALNIPPNLRDVESAALEATGETPITVKALARKAGYAYNSHFRDAVRRLIDLGLIVRVTGGVKRAGQCD